MVWCGHKQTHRACVPRSGQSYKSVAVSVLARVLLPDRPDRTEPYRAVPYTKTKKVDPAVSPIYVFKSTSAPLSPPPRLRQQVQQLPAAAEPLRIPQDREGPRVGMLHASVFLEGQARPALRGELVTSSSSRHRVITPTPAPPRPVYLRGACACPRTTQRGGVGWAAGPAADGVCVPQCMHTCRYACRQPLLSYAPTRLTPLPSPPPPFPLRDHKTFELPSPRGVRF